MLNPTHKTPMSNQPLYPIREISRLTGVNAITLRAWERRYGLIEPVRTDSGHRLYTQQDIDLLKHVVELTQQGIPISQIKGMLANSILQETQHPPENIDQSLQQAVDQYDITELNILLTNTMADLPGHLWQDTFSRISQALMADTEKLSFWESLLLPRLYSHLNLSLRHQKKAQKYVKVHRSSHTPKTCMLISALKLVETGLYALVEVSSSEIGHWVSDLQKINAEGIAFVSVQSQEEVPSVIDWQAKHPSFELWVFTNNLDEISVKNLNVHLKPI